MLKDAKLQSEMPSGWKIGDDTEARYKEAGIQISNLILKVKGAIVLWILSPSSLGGHYYFVAGRELQKRNLWFVWTQIKLISKKTWKKSVFMISNILIFELFLFLVPLFLAYSHFSTLPVFSWLFLHALLPAKLALFVIFIKYYSVLL